VRDAQNHTNAAIRNATLTVQPTRPVGITAYADRGEILNFGPVTAVSTLSTVRGMIISNNVANDTALENHSCHFEYPADEAVGSLTTTETSCVMAFNSTHVTGKARVVVQVRYGAQLMHEVPIRVWAATNATVNAQDSTLNRIDRVNVYPSCGDAVYQSTSATVTVSMVASGLITVRDIDITDIVTLVTSDASVVALTSPTLRGVAPGSATVSVAAPGTAQALTVPRNLLVRSL